MGRRRVAVMFVDLCGFAEFVESAGPEVAVGLVAPVMDRLVALARSHAGIIQQVDSDGFMSVYGLIDGIGGGGIGGGGEAVQAVRAARALIGAACTASTAGTEGTNGTDGTAGSPPIRVGVECGEVVVSRSWLPAGFAVWGSAVTAARQLCALARPGTAWIGPRAIELAGPEIRVTVPNIAGGAEINAPSPDTVLSRAWPAPKPLTRTELVVARLVAQGLSNPQIAQRLHISRHTAETHMKHIFAKLKLSSRAELAAWVARRLFAGEP